jgi:hypothetical protein
MTENHEDRFWQVFREELTSATKDISRLRSEIASDDQVAEFFVRRLMIACENATGCVCLGKLGLVVPLATVGRSLFESVISTFWASLTDDNARHAIESEGAELMRIMKNTIGACADRSRRHWKY